MSTQWLYPEDWKEWEVDPSTRTALHPFTKYFPFEITLTTEDVAEDIFNVADQSKAAVNLVTNPSVESSTVTMFTAVGSARTQDSGQSSDRSNSLLINPDNSAAGEGFYWTTPSLTSQKEGGSYIVFQVKVRGASASGDVELQIQDSSGTALVTGSTHSLTTGFVLLSIAYNIPQGTASSTYRCAVLSNAQHNINWYNDDIMVEFNTTGNVATYCDGTQGYDYEWEGTADASISRKRQGISIIRGLEIFTNDKIIYVAFDHTASRTATAKGIKLPVAALDSWKSNYPLDFRKRISFANGVNNETPAITGVVWGIQGS